MEVALFDLYTSGHHLPYANGIKRSLESVSDHEVTFVTLSETDRCTEVFDFSEIRYIDEPESPSIEEREGDFADIAEEQLERFCSEDRIGQYDVVHFLYADDILGSLWRHAPLANGPRIIGELNGVFFHRGTVLRRRYIHQLFLSLLESPVGEMIDAMVPAQTNHEALWQDLYLYRCLRSKTFDRLIVHSKEANKYLSKLQKSRSTPVEEVPYPAPDRFGSDFSKSEARSRLNLPSDGQILLFFGVMRNEKGVNFLLRALRKYQGPPFTVVLAGPASGVDERKLKTIATESSLNVVCELEFIDTPEVYYQASDAVILPYRRKYGPERASQMFQEVCSASRPVIVPDSGVLGRLTRQWELGETYNQSSIASLVSTLQRFANCNLDFSPEQMREYTNQHTFEQVAVRLNEIYTGKHEL